MQYETVKHPARESSKPRGLKLDENRKANTTNPGAGGENFWIKPMFRFIIVDLGLSANKKHTGQLATSFNKQNERLTHQEKRENSFRLSNVAQHPAMVCWEVR